ncbi:MAG: hypothetical protein CMJ78_01085 [Planctomycetaceae bacterium]|nr:hypothetical protein [Planctomycetaceae bacterium]
MLISSVIGYSLGYHNVLMQFQPMRRVKDKQIIKFSDITKSELRFSSTPLAFTRAGLEPQPISPENHVQAVKEMMEFLENGSIVQANQNLSQKKLRIGIQKHVHLTSDSLNLL